MLARIRNAHQALHADVVMPASKMKAAIASILKEEGYISEYAVDGRKLSINLKYSGGRPIISGLKKISKPGRRVYVGAGEIPRCSKRSRDQHPVHVPGGSGGQHGTRTAPWRRTSLRDLVADPERGAYHVQDRKKGNHPPAGVTVSVDPAAVTVKGPKGELQTPVHPKVVYAVEGATVTVNRVDDTRIVPGPSTACAARFWPTWSRARQGLHQDPRGHRRGV
jgi:ribosomal protein S8